MLLLDVTVRRDEVVLWILSLNCCQKRCMRKLSFDDIRLAEVQFKERKQTGKSNLVLEFLHNHSQINDSACGESETKFFVRGESVCREAWLLAHNLNKETFRRILNKFKDSKYRNYQKTLPFEMEVHFAYVYSCVSEMNYKLWFRGKNSFLWHQSEMATEFLWHWLEMTAEFLQHHSEIAAEFLWRRLEMAADFLWH